MKRSVKIQVAIHLIVLIFVGLSFLNVIPYSQPVSYTLSYVYPDSREEPLSLIVQVTVSASETIAEYVPVRLSNIVGSMTISLAEKVTSAAICFRGALSTGSVPIGYPCAGTFLLEFNGPVTGPVAGLPVYLGGPYLVGEDETIEWHVGGEYYATLVLYFGNGTRVLQDYPQNRVHVESASFVREEKRSHITLTLGIAAFVLGFTWVASFVEHRRDERKDDSIRRFDTKPDQKTKTTTDKTENNTGRKQRKSVSPPQKQHEKTRKQHQRLSDVGK